MKVLLLFPPHWVPTMPHLALPTLTAYLRSRGVETIQRDLNVEFFDRLLSRMHLENVLERLRRADRSARRVLLPAEIVAWASEAGPSLASQVAEAKGVLRGEAFFEGEASLQAFEVVADALALASLPFYPASFELTRFVSPVPVDSSAALLAAVGDPQINPFLDLFQRHVLPDIMREQPDLVGISIATMDQMLAAMTLCHLIKASGMACHITLGGPHVSMLRESLTGVGAVWNLFDSAIPFSGEIPLLRLVEALEKGDDLSAVPNLIYRDRGGSRDEGRVGVNAVCQPPSIDQLPMPDFDGLPLDLYLSPRLILPLTTTRGCYYGKCAFCNQGYGGTERFSQLEAGVIVERMLALHKRYGVRHIFFADEAITPRTLREMSKLLQAGQFQEAPVEWITCARFEQQLTGSLLAQMARGGCRMLLFGLESGSARVIAKIGKGTQVEQVGRILRESAEAGIWNHLFFFFGFPGETMDDAQATVDLVYRHGRDIHSASPGAFLLECYAPAHLNWRKYEIGRIIDSSEKDLSIYYDYEVRSGLDETTAGQVVDSLLQALPPKQFGQYYIHDSYRFLYASYLKQRGIPFPPWIG
ncbi:MAG: radical SAM protein [Anaerolineae bacterium]|nr:radical SAM protein [Anaerolineae bacterium]